MFLCLLLLGAVVRLLAWLAIHPAWWYIGDSIDYVATAVTGRPGPWRPSGYSLLMLMPLGRFHSLALVTLLQHGFGLAIAVVVYMLLLRSGLPAWGAALAGIPPLFDGYSIAIEQMVLSDTLFTLLCLAAFAIALWRRSRPALVTCIAIGLLLGVSGTVRTVGIPLLVCAWIALWFRRAGWLRLGMVTVAAALPIVAYVAWFAQTYQRPALTQSNGLFLYGRVSQFVDCGRTTFSTAELRAICPTGALAGRDEDFYTFSAQSPLARASADMRAADELGLTFALEAIRSQPGDYGWLVLRTSAQQFGWTDSGVGYAFAIPEPMNDQARLYGQKYLGRDPGPFYRAALVPWLNRYEGLVRFPGPLYLLALLLAAVGLALAPAAARSALAPVTVVTAAVVLVMFVVPAMTTAAPDTRFRIPATAFAALAGAAGLALLAARLGDGRKSLR